MNKWLNKKDRHNLYIQMKHLNKRGKINEKVKSHISVNKNREAINEK